MPLSRAVVDALTQVRHAVKTVPPSQLHTLYAFLLRLSAESLTRIASVTVGASSDELSQGEIASERSGVNVRDLWITPREAAHRLGRSERWLRRRRSKSPYCAFCINGDSGRGFRISAKGLDEYMERARRASR